MSLISRNFVTAFRHGSVALKRSPVTPAFNVVQSASYSDSITYSGGQASTGQGGFYGSGGSRSVNKAKTEQVGHAVVDVEDIAQLTQVMEKIIDLEDQLAAANNSSGSSINERVIEIKASLRRKTTGPVMQQLLERLEINGQPRWGLSTSERQLVHQAREMLNKA